MVCQGSLSFATIELALGIRLAVGRQTLDLQALVRIQDPQPFLCGAFV